MSAALTWGVVAAAWLILAGCAWALGRAAARRDRAIARIANDEARAARRRAGQRALREAVARTERWSQVIVVARSQAEAFEVVAGIRPGYRVGDVGGLEG